jgi:hypothetical protein
MFYFHYKFFEDNIKNYYFRLPDCPIWTGTACIFNVVTGVVVFVGAVMFTTEYGKCKPYFGVGQLYSKDGLLIANGNIDSCSRTPSYNW